MRNVYILLTLLFFSAKLLVFAAPTKAEAATNAERAYRTWEQRWQQEPANPEIAWQFARACFDWAEFAEKNKQRAHLAEQGVAACRQAIRDHPNSGPAHYYLGLNLGQQARSDKLGALRLVNQMEREFKTAIELNPTFDYAGAHRSLGLLYRDAPGWPASIGNRHKALDHLQVAYALAPEYPENWLNLLEAYLHWGEKEEVRQLVPVVKDKFPAARNKFSAPEWQWSWLDWDQRWEKIIASAAVKSWDPPRTLR